MDHIRRAAVAGSWYPQSPQALAEAVDEYLAQANGAVAAGGDLQGDLAAIVSPHAGLIYSGPVAAHAYRLLRDRRFDVAVLVGPSHFVGFDGVAVVPSGGFETPFGVARIDAACASDVMAATPIVRELASAHAREHSLEMQLPFLQHLAPDAMIVPLVMGYQTAEHRPRAGGGPRGGVARPARASRCEHRSVALSGCRHGRDTRRGGHRLRLPFRCRGAAGRAECAARTCMRRRPHGRGDARRSAPRRSRRGCAQLCRLGRRLG